MKAEYLIISKIKKIENICRGKAFKFGLEPTDLISHVNEKLCLAIYKHNSTFDHETQFWSFVQILVYNSAVDIHRKRMNFEDIENHKDSKSTNQKGIDLKNLSKYVTDRLYSEIRKDNHKAVFVDFFINDLKLQDISDKHCISLETVKGIIFRIRNKANQNYRHLYDELMVGA